MWGEAIQGDAVQAANVGTCIAATAENAKQRGVELSNSKTGDATTSLTQGAAASLLFS